MVSEQGLSTVKSVQEKLNSARPTATPFGRQINGKQCLTYLQLYKAMLR